MSLIQLECVSNIWIVCILNALENGRKNIIIIRNVQILIYKKLQQKNTTVYAY